MRKVNIYVKSSIKSTRKRDGYIGYMLELKGDKSALLSDYERVTQVTANQSELIAITKALKRMTEKCILTIYTDSKYIESSINNRWVEGWQKKGWVNAKREPIANSREWQNLLKLLVGQQFSVVLSEDNEFSTKMAAELERLKGENG